MILLEYKKSKREDNLDISFFFDYENRVKDRIIYKVINFEKNKDLLQGLPYVKYLDLAIVFYYLMPESLIPNVDGSILIKNEHMERWQITTNDLMSAASTNTPKLLGTKVQGIMSTIAEYAPDDDLAEMIVFAKHIAVAIKKAFPCIKVGMGVLGLEVRHAHIHLVPMQSEKDLIFSNPKLHPTNEELAEAAAKIRKEL